MFEEKQLLAVQMQLKDRIAAEERTIYELRRQIGEISASRNNGVASGQQSDDDETVSFQISHWQVLKLASAVWTFCRKKMYPTTNGIVATKCKK